MKKVLICQQLAKSSLVILPPGMYNVQLCHFLPIFTCNMNMESYRHIQNTPACFVHLEKSQQIVLLCWIVQLYPKLGVNKYYSFAFLRRACSFSTNFSHVIWLEKAFDIQITPVFKNLKNEGCKTKTKFRNPILRKKNSLKVSAESIQPLSKSCGHKGVLEQLR